MGISNGNGSANDEDRCGQLLERHLHSPIPHFVTCNMGNPYISLYTAYLLYSYLLSSHLGCPHYLSLLIKYFNTSLQFTIPHQHHIAHTTSGLRTRRRRGGSGYMLLQTYLLLNNRVKEGLPFNSVCMYLHSVMYYVYTYTVILYIVIQTVHVLTIQWVHSPTAG